MNMMPYAMGWKFHWTVLCVHAVVILCWNLQLSAAQSPCVQNIPTNLDEPFKETDLPSHLLLNVSVGVVLEESWSFTIASPVSATKVLDSYFSLTHTGRDMKVTLAKIFDLEEVYTLLGNQTVGFLEFTLQCRPISVTAPNVTYSFYASVTPVNEFAPEIVNLPAGGFGISESVSVSSTLVKLGDYVIDRDVETSPPGLDFSLIPASVEHTLDASQKMKIGDRLSGSVVLTQALDYESMAPAKAYYVLVFTVGDREGMTSTGTVRINVIDADDMPPEFFYTGCTTTPCFTTYQAAVASDFQGAVTWLEPAPIAARDQDTLRSPVIYSLKRGQPAGYEQYISIDRTNGALSVIKPVAGLSAASFRIIVEATEDTPLRHAEQTLLWLTVIGRNETGPTLPPVTVTPTSTADMFRITTIVLGVLLGLVLIILVIFVLCSTACSSKTKKTRPTNVLPSAFKPSLDFRLSNDEPGASSTDVLADDNSSADGSVTRQSVDLRKLSGDSGTMVDFFRSNWRPFKKVGKSKTSDAIVATSASSLEASIDSPASSSSKPQPPARKRRGPAYTGEVDTISNDNSIDNYDDEGRWKRNSSSSSPGIFRRSCIPEEQEEQELSMDIRDLELPGTEEIDFGDRGQLRIEIDSRPASTRLSSISGSELSPFPEHQKLVGNRRGSGGGDLGGGDLGGGISNPAYDDVRGPGHDGYDVGVIPLEQAPVMI